MDEPKGVGSPKARPEVARISVTWRAIGTAENVARSLEALAEKVRIGGDSVDLKASLSYQSKALRSLKP